MHRFSKRQLLLWKNRCCLLHTPCIYGNKVDIAIVSRRSLSSTLQLNPTLAQNSLWIQQQRPRPFGSASLIQPPYSLPLSLPNPTVVYSDNHLLAINKPAGWHSVPNIPKKRGRKTNSGRGNDDSNAISYKNNVSSSSSSSKKCLLTHLKSRGLGGGSNGDFLLPLHRIDQPCTGLLLFGKTSKAASRVTAVWKGKIKKKKKKKKRKKDQQQEEEKHQINSNNNDSTIDRGVLKEYLCVVPTLRLAAMEEVSLAATARWSRLEGLMLRPSASSTSKELYGIGTHRRWQQQKYYNSRRRKGKSVKIVRRWHDKEGESREPEHKAFYEYNHSTDHAIMRPVGVEWRVVDVPGMDPTCSLLLVRTSEGARHMVRALLAQVGGCPIVGDVRYWTNRKRETGAIQSSIIDGEDNADRAVPLGDRSVALHAYSVSFDERRLQLGSLDIFEFRAPIPETWKSFFGIDNSDIEGYLRETD